MTVATPPRSVDRLMSPEGVPLCLEVAGVGVRLGAQIIDVLATTLPAFAFVVLIQSLDLAESQGFNAIAAMLFLFSRIPYYVLIELAWNGQTIGKRLMQIKVVASDGRSLTAHALVIRNITKEAEIFSPGTLILVLGADAPVVSIAALVWMIGVLLVPLVNRRRRRLGDLAAGTYVVHLPSPMLLADLARADPKHAKSEPGFTFLTHHLDHYGVYELQTLERVIRAQDTAMTGSEKARHTETEARIVEAIRRKISYADAVPADDRARFLRDFYRAQRAHLEQRQLFGDHRVNKFYKEKHSQSQK
ncbi:MAG: RDD family protein [Pseudomonadota bacterium]